MTVKRAGLVLGAATAIALALILTFSRRPSPEPLKPTARKTDSVWYHASDVALLATTGRPQLVEFFHPG